MVCFCLFVLYVCVCFLLLLPFFLPSTSSTLSSFRSFETSGEEPLPHYDSYPNAIKYTVKIKS